MHTIDRVQSRAHQLCKLLGIKETLTCEKSSIPTGLFFVHKHGLP